MVHNFKHITIQLWMYNGCKGSENCSQLWWQSHRHVLHKIWLQTNVESTDLPGLCEILLWLWTGLLIPVVVSIIWYCLELLVPGLRPRWTFHRPYFYSLHIFACRYCVVLCYCLHKCCFDQIKMMCDVTCLQVEFESACLFLACLFVEGKSVCLFSRLIHQLVLYIYLLD